MPYLINVQGSDARSVSKDFDPPITMEYKVHLRRTRPMTPAERAAVPTRLRVGKPRRGGTPHILGWILGPWIVSNRVHDIIEELEPGVQDFSPIELLSEEGGTTIGTYYLILPPPQLDAVIVEETEFCGKRGRLGSSFLSNDVIVLRASVIRGRHFWRGSPPLELSYFCSDELRDRLKAELLDGWDLRRRCVVRDQ